MTSTRPWRSLTLFWVLVLAILYAPLAVVIMFSFNDANTTAHFSGFSLKWYSKLFSDEQILGALRKSFILAIASSSLSTVFGAMLGYGMYKYRGRRIALLVWLIYLPIVMPDIVYGISEMTFFTRISDFVDIFTPSLITMVFAHVSFQLPFVALVVYSRLVGLDPRLFDACRDLYASGWQRARFFIVPTLKPALLSAFFLAVTLSIDDFVISFFTAGPDSTTLPIYIWSAIKKGITPKVNAIATIMISLVFAGALVSFFAQYIRSAMARTRTTGKVINQSLHSVV